MIGLAGLLTGWVFALEPEPGMKPSPDLELVGALSHSGPVLDHVHPGRPAANAGMREGDILHRWHLRGTEEKGEFRNMQDAIDFAREVLPRGQVRLTYVRDGRINSIEIDGFRMGVRLRPHLSNADLTAYRRAEEAFEVETPEEGIALLSEHALKLERYEADPNLVSWFFERTMTAQAREGRWDDMEVSFARALNTVSSLNRPSFTARLFEQKAHLYGNVHEYRRALTALEKAAEIGGGTQPYSHTIRLTLMGKYSRLSGNLSKAEIYLHKAVAAAEELNGKSPHLVFSLTNLGTLAQAVNDLETAETHLMRAYKMGKQEYKESLLFAETLNQVGRLNFFQGNYRRSKDYFTRELELRLKLAPEGTGHFGALNGLGAVAWKSQDQKAAIKYIERAIKLLQEKEPENLLLAKLLGNLAYIQLKNHRPHKASEYFLKAVEILQDRAPDNLMLANMLFGVGRAWRELEKPEKSLLYFDQGRELIEDRLARFVAAEDVRANYSGKYRKLYAEQIDLLIEMDRPEEAFDILENYHARVFLDMLGERDLMHHTDIPADLQKQLDEVQRSTERLQEELDHLADDDRNRKRYLDNLRHLRTERADLYDQVKQSIDRPVACETPEPLTHDQIRRNLKPGSLMLSYLVQDEHVLLFTLSNKEAPRAVRLKLGNQPGEKLRQMVMDFRRFLMKPDNRTAEVMMTGKSRDLYKALIEPVAAQIAQYDRILIVPDGPLRILPFSALQNGRQYLIEQKPIAVLNSGSVYDYLDNRNLRDKEDGEEPKPEVDKSWYAFGDPTYETKPITEPEEEASAPVILTSDSPTMYRSSSKNFGSLVHSLEEVEYIGRHNSQARVLTGSQASESRAEELLDENTAVIHFSCHGFYDEEYPLNSALALSDSEEEKGYLHAWEIMDNYSLDAELVVLASCESGLGKDFGADGLLGLTRAFQYAGAKAVVASLWRVSDLSTAYLMKQFYGFMDKGQNKAQALRSAKMDMISKRDDSIYSKFSHPFYWAGFQLHGNWEPIESE